MNNNQRKFKDLVDIYKATTFTPAESKGLLFISSEEICQCIEDLLQSPDDYGITVESGDISVGSTVHLHIGRPKLKFGQFHDNFEDFLKNSKNRVIEPSNYYIIQENYHNKDDNTPALIEKYRVALRLINLFKNAAAYLDETNCEVVFVDSGVFRISLNYNSDDLSGFNAEDALNFIANFADDTHLEHKLTILANSIRSISDTKEKSSSFSYLLRDLNQLIESVNKGYKIYISGFSYEKILDQLRAAKIEDLGKIHKVFSDIQNQVLGIPVATIVVATQMKQTTNAWDSQALTNTIVMLGALFFTAMILFILFNQFQTLNAIEDELRYKENQASSKYSSIYEDIRLTFKSLMLRLNMQRAAFGFLALFVVAGIVLTFRFYFLLTPYAYNFIFN